MKKHLAGILCAVTLTAFTAYVLLDAFVIPRRYAVADSSDTVQTTIATAVQTAATSTQATTAAKTTKTVAAAVTDTTYTDDHVSVTLKTYRAYDTSIYVADITVSDAKYLKTAFAEDTYGKNITETTSAIAAAHDAVLAINGDYYSARSGYVLRGGKLYRSTADRDQEDLVIGADGSFSVINESDVTAQSLLDNGAMQLLSFGPALLQNGSITVSENDEVGKAMTSNPRTAIGCIGKLHYVMLVSDGRTAESAGLTLYQLAAFMKTLGVQTAYNLDGGGSSTMVFCGKVVNNPTTNGKRISERSVSDIVYIGK